MLWAYIDLEVSQHYRRLHTVCSDRQKTEKSSVLPLTLGFQALPLLWQQLPCYCAKTCNADGWMMDLIESRRTARDAATNVAEFASRDFPSINSLVNPSSGADADVHVSSVVARHLTNIVRVHTLPEKIAVRDCGLQSSYRPGRRLTAKAQLLYVISQLLRWQIMPSEATYACIPGFARPTLPQIAVPHPCWVGTIGW